MKFETKKSLRAKVKSAESNARFYRAMHDEVLADARSTSSRRDWLRDLAVAGNKEAAKLLLRDLRKEMNPPPALAWTTSATVFNASV